MKDESVEGAIRRVLAGRRGDSPGPCPDANELAAFLEARLNPEEAARFEAHAADCSACRQVLALSLDLAPREGEQAAPPVLPAKTLSYRFSPLRLALGAAFALLAGVLLFQSVRDSRMQPPKYEIARRQQDHAVTAGQESALDSRERSAAVGQAQPTTPAGRIDSVEKMPLPAEEKMRAVKPEPAVAGKPAASTLAENSASRLTPASRPETAKPQTVDAVAEAIKERKAVSDTADLKDKLAFRADEARGGGAKTAEQAAQVRKETVVGQAGNEVISAQNANVPRQAANTQLQAANTQMQAANVVFQNTNVVSQTANTGAQAAGGILQTANAPAQAAGAPGRPANVPLQGAAPEAGSAKARSIDPVQQAIAEAGLGKKQRQAYAIMGEAKLETGRKVGSRIFYRTRNYWVDGASVEHADATVREIARDSDEYREMIKKEPLVADLPDGLPVVLFWNGNNCVIRVIR